MGAGASSKGVRAPSCGAAPRSAAAWPRPDTAIYIIIIYIYIERERDTETQISRERLGHHRKGTPGRGDAY